MANDSRFKDVSEIPTRFWVGSMNSNLVVYDALEQVDGRQLVYLWNVDRRKMESYQPDQAKRDVVRVSDRDEWNRAIAHFRKHYDPGREIRNKFTRLTLIEEAYQKRNAAAERFFGEYYYHPQNGDPSSLFNEECKQESYPVLSWLLQRADEVPKPLAQSTASAFAQWVYDLYYATEPNLHTERDWYRPDKLSLSDEFKMEMGRFAEREIERLRIWFNQQFPRSIGREWRLLSVDDGQSEKVYVASRLTVNREPLRCKPDLVLLNECTGEILIVERKLTFVPEEHVPVMGWANLKAQLWCYAWIDDWLNAPNVYLVGQFWERNELRDYPFMPNFRLMKHRIPRWQRNDMAFDASMRRLFQKYGGTLLDVVAPT